VLGEFKNRLVRRKRIRRNHKHERRSRENARGIGKNTLNAGMDLSKSQGRLKSGKGTRRGRFF